jgi:hypothetical protein
MKRFCFVLYALLLFASSCTIVPLHFRHNETRQQGGDLKTMAQWLTGRFDSGQQASEDSDYFDVTLTCVRIWRARTDGYWLYVEQTLTRLPKKPYRQRVYHIHRDKDAILSDIYELNHPENRVNKFKPMAFSDLTLDSLTLKDGCRVTLRREGQTFAGATTGNGCSSTLKGAAYATSQVQLFADRVVSWDRGYNTEGKQMWGAEKGGYVFMRKETFPF